MNCEQYRQILDEGSLSELPPAVQAAFHAHRLQCPECDRLYQLDQTWQNALREDQGNSRWMDLTSRDREGAVSTRIDTTGRPLPHGRGSSMRLPLREDVADTNLDSATFTQAVLQRVDAPVSDDQAFITLTNARTQTNDEPVALSFRKHWLPVSLAAAIALGLLSGLWYQLAQKPPTLPLNNPMAQQPAAVQGSGAAMVSLVRTVQGQWVSQPLAMIDGMPVVRLQVDWQVMLERVPHLLPDPARFTDPPTPEHKEQHHGQRSSHHGIQLG